MTLEVVNTCPLGHTCEEIKDNKIHRCMWYTKVVGKNPQSGEEIDQWNCAISWGPIIAIEGNRTNREMVATFQSMRNAALDNQRKALEKKDNG